MSSIESLSMGLVCLTELVREYQNFIPDHPFINVNKQNLKEKILDLTKRHELLVKKKINTFILDKSSFANNNSSLLVPDLVMSKAG